MAVFAFTVTAQGSFESTVEIYPNVFEMSGIEELEATVAGKTSLCEKLRTHRFNTDSTPNLATQFDRISPINVGDDVVEHPAGPAKHYEGWEALCF